MGDANCTGDGCEDGDEGLPLRSRLMLIYAVFGGIFAFLIFVAEVMVRRERRGLHRDPGTPYNLLEAGLAFARALCLGAVWPLVVTYVLTRRPPDPVRVRAEIMEDILRRRPANNVRRTPNERRWNDRGWLIMMRWRHKKSLARRPEGWLTRVRQRFRRPQELAFTSGDQNISPVEVELEAGSCSDWNLVRAVVTVVEIQEEGLFRHIITYL